MPITFSPIGAVASPQREPLRPEALRGLPARLVLAARFAPAVASLKAGQHLWVVYHLHLAEPALGPPAVQSVVAALRSKDEDVRTAAVRVLGRIGDARAVKPLIDVLKNKDKHVRKVVASVLVELYQSGRLDERHKRLVLAQQKTIQKRHVDKPGESKRYSFDRSESYALHPSDCSHIDNHADTPHTDEGISVDFPV